MSLIVLVVVVCVLLNCSALFQVNFVGDIFNFLRSAGLEKQWEAFTSGPAAEANRYGQETAESLGPIGNTTGMASDLYGRARGLGAQFSDQNVRDVNQRFDQLGASGQAGLRARGLGGSTIAPSLAYANERNRGDELRRVNDDRLGTLLGIESTFGGGEIAANQAAADARLRGLEGRYLFPPGQQTPFQMSSLSRM
jgi:hypothetical protein